MSDEKKEVEIVMLPQVEKQVAEDPEMAEAMRDFSAALRQAFHAVETGQHKSFDDAMEAITGSRPKKVDLDEIDDIVDDDEDEGEDE